MLLSAVKKFIRKTHSNVREKIKEHTRSSKWHEVRNEYLEKESKCAACGSRKNLQVHHKKPFHLHPELELNSENFIALCMDVEECHLLIGHGDSFKFYNPNVESDAKRFMSSSKDERKKIIAEARANRLNA